MRTEALICNSEIKLPNQECICILEYCHKKLKSLHFHVLLWKLGFHTEKKKKEETEFLKLSLLIYRRNSEVQNSKSFSLTEFFFISSSRTFETTRNASQGSDYVQLPEK